MNQQPQQRINHLISTLQRYFPLLIVPAIAGLVLALFYAFFLMPETWTARQSFLIRDDLSGTAFKPGRFDSEESRKSAQETILEVARRPLVVRNVLEKLGPESSISSSNWITDEVIEDTQKEIDISAPNGAEFGKTDAIVLTAKSSSRERTRKFIELLSAEIMTQTNRIRSLRFESMESELYQAYQAADRARDEAIDRLDELDQRLGSDFGFLSLQGNQPTGVEAIKSEILRKQDELEKAESIFAALLKAFDNPATASQLPSEVLIAQPALENAMTNMLNLREQLHVAKGTFSDKHARVKAIALAIKFSEKQLYDSLTGEMAGVQEDIALTKRQLARLNNRIEELKSRLIRLSKSRSEHLALTTQVQQLGAAANLARTAWTETQSRAKTARSVGLITPTDVAQVSTRPDGIGKKYVALAGLVGGLLIGIGLVLLVAPNAVAKPKSSPLGDTALQTPDRQTVSSRVPQHRTSIAANTSTASGTATSTGSFQHAASAMQSAADAMRMAATGETIAPSSVSMPSQSATATRPQPASNETPVRPADKPRAQPAARQTSSQPATSSPNPIADEAVRMAFKSQSSTVLPRDARVQPVSGPTNSSKTAARTNPQSNATTANASTPVNVRPVDLAKSASVNNEFVQVDSATQAKSTTPTTSGTSNSSADSPRAESVERQRSKVDSSVLQSASAIADSVATSHAAGRSPQRKSPITTILSDGNKASNPQKSSKRRKPAGTEPFVVAEEGETPPEPAQDVIDAIPDQIRKLSESILKFGKDKK